MRNYNHVHDHLLDLPLSRRFTWIVNHAALLFYRESKTSPRGPSFVRSTQWVPINCNIKLIYTILLGPSCQLVTLVMFDSFYSDLRFSDC